MQKSSSIKSGIEKYAGSTPAPTRTEASYDPQGSGQDHDRIFREIAPGAADSGNMKHKWGTPEGHTHLQQPPSGKKSE
jgi:hypothetical protein